MTALAPPGGDLTIPCWTARPGSIEAFQHLGGAMPVWILIRSINGTPNAPCFASDATLARTLLCSRGTIRNRMAGLRSVPGLLLEVRRPRLRGSRLPTVLRWATDPFAKDSWYRQLAFAQLPRIASHFGLSGEWLLEATMLLSKHATLAHDLGQRIKLDLLSPPSTEIGQYGVGVVR